MNKKLLDIVTLVVSLNDNSPVVNVDRLGRSIHYINSKKNILDRSRVFVLENDSLPIVNIDSLGRSISSIIQ